MSAPWLAYVALLGLFISVAASGIDAGLRAIRRPTRWVWALAIAALLVFSIGSLRREAPERSVRVEALTALPTAATVSPTAAPRVSALQRAQQASDALLRRTIATAAVLMPASIGRVFKAVWLVTSLLAGIMIAVIQLRMTIARRRWPTADLHGRRVRLSPDVGPAVIGLARPDIVVPQWLLTRDVTEQRVAVQHEAEHLRVHDHLLLTGATLLVAAMPWHPAAWWMLARLRLAMELDCDARIIRAGVAPRQYGEMLIDLAGACAGVRFGAVALADRRSHLERRLIAMTPNTSKSARGRIVLSLCAGALALAAACEARVPTSSEIESMDVSGAERALAKTPMMPFNDTSKVTFYVDGVLKTAEQAHSITANAIKSISVDHSSGGGKTVVRVSTTGTLDTAAISKTDGLLALHNQLYNGMKSLHGKVAGMVHHDSASADSHSSVTLRVHDDAPFSVSGGNAEMRDGHMTMQGGRGFAMSNTGSFEGIVYVDGVRSSKESLNTLDPNRIATVEIVKATAAEPRGHISVTMKK